MKNVPCMKFVPNYFLRDRRVPQLQEDVMCQARLSEGRAGGGGGLSVQLSVVLVTVGLVRHVCIRSQNGRFRFFFLISILTCLIHR